MASKRFKRILLVYAAIWLTIGFVAVAVGVSTFPINENLIEELQTNKELQTQVQENISLAAKVKKKKNIIGGTIIVCLVVAWIGLFLSWKPATYIFGIYLFTSYLIEPFFDYELMKVLVEGPISDHYIRVFMNADNPALRIMRTISVALDSVLALLIFTKAGRSFLMDDENHT